MPKILNNHAIFELNFRTFSVREKIPTLHTACLSSLSIVQSVF